MSVLRPFADHGMAWFIDHWFIEPWFIDPWFIEPWFIDHWCNALSLITPYARYGPP